MVPPVVPPVEPPVVPPVVPPVEPPPEPPVVPPAVPPAGRGPRPPVTGPGIGRRPPWSPFGPGDSAQPDAAAVAANAASVRAGLEKLQLQLTGLRYGPGKDNTRPPIRDVTRADGLWPWLLIRHAPGDVGARPLDATTIADIQGGHHNSPDIIITRGAPVGGPDEVGRDGIDALVASGITQAGWARGGSEPIDVWVHVWNLGRSPATGVRVRVFSGWQGTFLGGRQVDLAGRGRDGSHRVIKVATFTASSQNVGWHVMTAVAECMTDTASGDRSPGADRHCAHRVLLILG